MNRVIGVLGAFGLVLGLGACSGGGDGTPPDPPIEGDDYQLSDVDALLEGAPDNVDLPEEGKADATYPAQFDLVATQSPVRSQGRRGVCSIFSTTGLMEHLYLKEGTLEAPDFSEQFLQWSVKNEVGSFPNTSGSNARSNLDALSRHGSVLEADWPYEASGWGTSNDEACTGDEQPTRCYTNGEPPASALAATRWHVPRGRWINSRPRSIKGHMSASGTAVVAGMTFFYQAWGHGGTMLPRYTGYRSQGYIVAPNDADVTDSELRRAGHSILLVGWDDDLEVQAVDENGVLAVDDAGEPVMQKGFFLFKNSWGTGWGQENPFGDGYGWISYEYVERFASIYASGVPELMLAEVCGDGRDNDFNGAADCADAACSGMPACSDPTTMHENTTAAAIPDNDPTGVTSTLEVTEAGTLSSVAVDVEITHSYRGDLLVTLEKGDTVVTLHDREGAGADDVVRTFDVTDFNGEDAAGTWALRVVDSANADTGSIVRFGLTLTRCAGDCGTPAVMRRYENDTLGVIPDNDTAGVSSDIEVPDAGTIAAVRVHVDITHAFPFDLTLTLQRVGGGEVVLVENPDTEDPAFVRSFTLADFNGEDAAGTWRLVVSDGAAGDEGTLNSWALEVTPG